MIHTLNNKKGVERKTSSLLYLMFPKGLQLVMFRKIKKGTNSNITDLDKTRTTIFFSFQLYCNYFISGEFQYVYSFFENYKLNHKQNYHFFQKLTSEAHNVEHILFRHFNEQVRIMKETNGIKKHLKLRKLEH